MKFSSEQREYLTRILAAVDTVFAPYRCRPGSLSAPAAIAQLRRGYRSAGIPFAVGGDGDRRQTGRKVLQSLQSAGLIRQHRSKSTRRQVSLLPLGDAVARSLCGLPLAHDSFGLLCGAISDAYEAGLGENRGYIPESRVPASERELLPLLVRGWLLSASDGQGRVGYGLTGIADEGRQNETVRVSFEVEAVDDLPTKDPKCASLYEDLLGAGLEARELWRPEKPASDIHVPLSAGLWPGADI